jgi:NAD(P)H-dependent FMN reductase
MSDSSPRILVFAGSARAASFNKKLAAAAAQFAREEGAEVTLADLREFPMPLYDGDLEEREGMPEHAAAFKRLMVGCDGLLIASPEYNSSLSPLLKNAIDWASRSESDDEIPMQAFKGKAAGLMAASPGKLGGLRGLVHLRSILGNIGVMVVPDQIAVGGASEAFDAEGRLTNGYYEKGTRAVVKRLVTVAGWMRSRTDG